MNPLLNPLSHPICLTSPKRLAAASGWNEQVPFAMYLLSLARPSMVVQLRTHTGVSDCAFSEGVAALGLDTHCCAVDIEEASGRFPDRSIDLLHVDSCNPYERARAHFQRWLP